VKGWNEGRLRDRESGFWGWKWGCTGDIWAYHVSTPNIGIPKSENDSACGIEKYIYAHLDILSPPQCPAHRPDPGAVERPMIKGRFPGKTCRRP
jgi:hypothetical protein